MRKTIGGPSLANDLGALADLYRTVFWMMGRKVQYGRVWPEPERDEPPLTLLDEEREVTAGAPREPR